MLAIPWLVLAFAWVAAPSFTGLIHRAGVLGSPFLGNRAESPDVLGLPVSALPLVFGALGVVIGYVWMWKLYRAPTRFEGARWRFHDH